MIKVRKGNTQYSAEDVKKEHFLALGFDVIDDKGAVIETAPIHKSKLEDKLTNEIIQLKKTITKQKAEIKELKETEKAKEIK